MMRRSLAPCDLHLVRHLRPPFGALALDSVRALSLSTHWPSQILQQQRQLNIIGMALALPSTVVDAHRLPQAQVVDARLPEAVSLTHW